MSDDSLRNSPGDVQNALERFEDLSRSRIFAALFGIAIIGTCLSLLIAPYTPYKVNAIFHIPLLEAKLNPALFPNDYAIRFGNVYDSAAWWIAARLAPHFGLMSALHVLFFVQQFLFHFAAAFVVYVIGRNIAWALFASLYFTLGIMPFLGAAFFYSNYFTHTAFSVPFFLFGLGFFLARRYFLCLCFWTAGTAIHMPNGVFNAPFFGAAIAYGVWNDLKSSDIREKRRVRIELVSGLVVAVLFILPLAIRILSGGKDAAPLTMNELRAVAYPHTEGHIFWEKWLSPGFRIGFAAQTLLATVLFLVAWRRVPPLRGYAFGYATLFIPLLIGIFSVNVFPSTQIARLMWMRIGDYFCLYAVVLALAILPLWARGAVPLSRGDLPIFAFILLYASTGDPWAWLLAACVPAVCYWSICKTGKSVAELFGQFLRVKHLDRPSRFVFPVTVTVIVAGYAVFGYLQAGFERHLSQSFNTDRNYANWRDVQLWAEKSTAKETRFLTPIFLPGWRLFSRRSTFVEMRDAANAPLSNALAREYMRRIRVMGCAGNGPFPRLSLDDAQKIYDKLPLAELRRIGAAEHVQFAVVLSGTRASREDAPVYSNRTFAVMKL